jgi:CHRD domain
MEAFMTARSVLLPVIATSLLLATACNDATSDQTLFRAALSGANEVPPRPTPATGSASLALDGDTVFFSIEVQQIDQVVAAHIHSGAVGVNGPVRVDLFLGPATGPVNGLLVEGTFTAADVRGVTFEEILEQMRTGAAYVNVHTTEFPGGAVRGQVQLTQ